MSCLVVTGMHRSGTSLAMSLLQAAGMDVGERLLPADRANPRGFFEDADFYDFHEHALRAREQTILPTEPFVFAPSAEEQAAAAELVGRRGGKALWGWKDPRTCLFLDFWAERVPDARFLFLYRHPLDVLMSLVRRRDLHSVGLREGVDAWCVYNEAILRFVERRPERSLLCHAYAALDRIEDWTVLLARTFDLRLALTPALRDRLYHRDELRRLPLTAEVVALAAAIHPPAAELYSRLQAEAALPGADAPAAAAPRAGHAQLAALAATVPWPRPPALTRGLLLVLLALLDEGASEALYTAHGDDVAELERAKAWLEQQHAVDVEELERRQAWSDDLERSKAWAEAQHANWQTQAEEGQRYVAELRDWIGELERAKAWLEEDAARWRQAAERAQAEAGVLRSYVTDLASRRLFRLLSPTGMMPKPPARARDGT